MGDSFKSLTSDDQVEAIRSLVRGMPELQNAVVGYDIGAAILEEGQVNDRLLILIEGIAKLSKLDEDDSRIEVDVFSPGSILGLTSFWGRQPVFARVEAMTPVKCIGVERKAWEDLLVRYPEFVKTIQGLFVSNLSDRYRNMIHSHVERSRLSRQLENERNQLRDTLEKLEQTTHRLINQEKLATMGQLVAGIAHEINNPVGALARGVATARESLDAVFGVESKDPLERTMLDHGLECPFWSSDDKRNRMESIQKLHPDMKRSAARRVAQLTDEALDALKPLIKKKKNWSNYLSLYELGVCLRSVDISAGRIENLVTGLKNYGRQSGSSWAKADLVSGIRDTLTVLNNRLKRYELTLELADEIVLNCNLGEINQVWTNLLSNAMDATDEGKAIKVSCFVEDETVVTCIEDSGTGVDDGKLQKIFEPNFTTKNQSGSYGLGLGLSISKEIVEKHGGSICAGRSELGGAMFKVSLPAKTDS